MTIPRQPVRRGHQFGPNDFLPYIFSSQAESEIVLKALDIKVEISGLYSSTTQTMTFYNPNHRDLEGELTFPMPDNASVCGYALDVDGELVDGVIIPKEKARQILETEIRKGVDPGLVEHVQGNLYRTRVYPIPAQGSRTVRIKYINDLVINNNDAAYHLPLQHAASIDKVSVRIDVIKSSIKPELSGIGNLTLNNWEDKWVAEAEITPEICDDLLIRLPNLPDTITSIESYNGEHFFNVSLKLPEKSSIRPVPQNIAIAWDASGSRDNLDKDLEFLKALSEKWSNTQIQLLVFRNTFEPIEHFDNFSSLIPFLKELPYDGATTIADLPINQFNECEFCLLFSDGLINLNRGVPSIALPLITINSLTKCDSSYLEYVAEKSGGLYLNLLRANTDDAIKRISEANPTYNLSSESGCSNIHINQSQGRLNILGKLTENYAQLCIIDSEKQKLTIEVAAADAGISNNIARAWASLQSREIALFDQESEELIQLGRQFELVTPGTSLLVLETLQQHIEHKVEPAKSRKKLHKQYLEHLSSTQASTKKKDEEHIEYVVQLWEERINWWKTDFSDAPEQIAPNPNEMDAHSAAPSVPPQSRQRMLRRPPTNACMDLGSDQETVIPGNYDNCCIASPSFDSPAPASEPPAAPGPTSTAASIQIKPWEPDTPYLKIIKQVENDAAYNAYLEQRKQYCGSPAFFLDCGDYFFTIGQSGLAKRILSNLLELELDSIPLLRIYAWRLQQANELNDAIDIFERIRKIRDDEPQSHRDLALALSERWAKDNNGSDAVRSMELLYNVISSKWERFPEIELIALMELNRLIFHCKSDEGVEIPEFIDKRLIQNLDLDIRISMSWDADLTDVDLHVFEPNGGHAYYAHNRTLMGGLVSRDFTQGYGPEEYVLRNAMPGKYLIKAHYYGSHQQSICGPCTITATVFTNYGRSDESKHVLTIRLDSPSHEELVGEIEIGTKDGLKKSDKSDLKDKLNQLEKGMSLDQVKAIMGNPDNISGDSNIILTYTPNLNEGDIIIELHMSPTLVMAKQIMNGAELELLNHQ